MRSMESMDRYTGCRDITEIMLKTALNTIQPINHSFQTTQKDLTLTMAALFQGRNLKHKDNLKAYTMLFERKDILCLKNIT